MALDWYVAKIKRNQVSLVENQLVLKGLEVYTPQIVGLSGSPGKREALFPGYIFCHMDVTNRYHWPSLLWTPGLSYLLPAEDRPSPLVEDAVDEIRMRVEEWNRGGYVRVFEKGDHVKIKSGPLKGLDAIFGSYLPARERCEVLLYWLGGKLATLIDPRDLDAVPKVRVRWGWERGATATA